MAIDHKEQAKRAKEAVDHPVTYHSGGEDVGEDADKGMSRELFDSYNNENIRGERIRNKQYPEEIKSAKQKKQEEETREKIDLIPKFQK